MDDQHQALAERNETALLAQSALESDWLNADENAAWTHLQPEHIVRLTLRSPLKIAAQDGYDASSPMLREIPAAGMPPSCDVQAATPR